ncbi:tRNA lysidine(34) synthetase TilS [Pseudoalteromonas sp. YIC-656]|uniref:tRNA lysidine(34) synthetase TilS n=1 Tax=Pseudoalteromonas pernae TaxID=3118054 RepID=UPI003242A498
MQTRFDNTLSQLLHTVPECSGLAVALSGGLDSMALLELARNYAIKVNMPLCAIHIHHGLSANADAWLAFTQQACAARGIAFYSQRVRLSNATRKGIEAKAREARYQAIDAQAPKGYAILLGQHKDDQVETFFLRLKRGAGVKGLGAMQAVSHGHNRVLIRPLLDFSRNELAQFVDANGLTHIHDESNDDNKFDRNFLRNDVLPLLNERFHGFNDKVAQAANLLQSQQSLLDEFALADLQSAQQGEERLCTDTLVALGPSRCINALRYWLAVHHYLMPSQAKLAEFLQQLTVARDDSQPEIVIKSQDGHKGYLRRYNAHLYLVGPEPKIIDQLIDIKEPSIVLSDGRTILLCAGEGIRLPNETESVTVKFGQLSAKIRPQSKPYSNKLSHWLKELRVPPWQRQQIPLIFYNETLVAVVGYFYNHDFLASQGLQWQIKTPSPM